MTTILIGFVLVLLVGGGWYIGRLSSMGTTTRTVTVSYPPAPVPPGTPGATPPAPIPTVTPRPRNWKKWAGLSTGLVLSMMIILTIGYYWGTGHVPLLDSKTTAGGVATKMQSSAEIVQRPEETICIEVAEIPSDRTGDFCAPIKAKVPTKMINPPPGKLVQIFPSVPIVVEFFDRWDNWKSTGKVPIDGLHKGIPFPDRWTDLTITSEDDGRVRFTSGVPPRRN